MSTLSDFNDAVKRGVQLVELKREQEHQERLAREKAEQDRITGWHKECLALCDNLKPRIEAEVQPHRDRIIQLFNGTTLLVELESGYYTNSDYYIRVVYHPYPKDFPVFNKRTILYGNAQHAMEQVADHLKDILVYRATGIVPS